MEDISQKQGKNTDSFLKSLNSINNIIPTIKTYDDKILNLINSIHPESRASINPYSTDQSINNLEKYNKDFLLQNNTMNPPLSLSQLRKEPKEKTQTIEELRIELNNAYDQSSKYKKSFIDIKNNVDIISQYTPQGKNEKLENKKIIEQIDKTLNLTKLQLEQNKKIFNDKIEILEMDHKLRIGSQQALTKLSEQQHNELQSLYSGLESEYKALQKKYNELETIYSDKDSNYRILWQKHEQLKKMYYDLESRDKTLQQKHGELENFYSSLGSINKNLQNKYDELDIFSSDLDSEHRILQEQYNDMKSKHETLTQAHELLQAVYKSLTEKPKIMESSTILPLESLASTPMYHVQNTNTNNMLNYSNSNLFFLPIEQNNTHIQMPFFNKNTVSQPKTMNQDNFNRLQDILINTNTFISNFLDMDVQEFVHGKEESLSSIDFVTASLKNLKKKLAKIQPIIQKLLINKTINKNTTHDLSLQNLEDHLNHFSQEINKCLEMEILTIKNEKIQDTGILKNIDTNYIIFYTQAQNYPVQDFSFTKELMKFNKKKLFIIKSSVKTLKANIIIYNNLYQEKYFVEEGKSKKKIKQ